MASRKILWTGIWSFLFIMALGANEETGVLTESIPIYGEGTPPAYLDSSRDWAILGSIDWEAVTALPSPDGVTKKWRLRTSYEHEAAAGPSTLQIRIDGVADRERDRVVFTHPWSEGPDRRFEAYSNWYIPEDVEPLRGRGYLEARLVAPPRTPLRGKIHSVILEVWEVSDNPGIRPRPSGAPDVELAYASPLPFSRSGQTEAEAVELGRSWSDALDFALSFLETCLTGDLPGYYRGFSDTLRSLDDGKAMSKYRVPPPGTLYGIDNLDAYRDNYIYRIYGPEEYRDLFPEWFDGGRPWIPGEDHYLFLGGEKRRDDGFPVEVSYLVFMVAPREGGGWTIVARPGS